ncbi:MAG: hypothetical protein OXN20_13085, partial [Gemmatimonadota bacterium]|nr:hypothetical protein [Gemmatimonadota bacterium]
TQASTVDPTIPAEATRFYNPNALALGVRQVEHLGMGVRNRIIGSMRDHNGTEPDLIEEDHRFTVRLWKDPEDTPS